MKRAVPILVFAALHLAACTQDGFECGSPAPDDPEVIRRCDRPQEICVCATRSCAVPAEINDAGYPACDSGYRYTEAPFADPAHARKCVQPHLIADEDEFLSSKEIGLACEPFEAATPEPEDGGMDAGDGGDAGDAGDDAGDAGDDAGDAGPAPVDDGGMDAGDASDDDDDSGSAGGS